MKSNDMRVTTRATATVKLIACAVLAVGAAGAQVLAGERFRLPTNFSGLLNDYTPFAPAVTGGPYEMHGKWSLHLHERGSAIFTAEMTMETADFANTDAVGHDPTKLGPHTHHISVTDGVIHDDPTDSTNWKALCPGFKPPVSDGFVVTGTAYVTGNGGSPPFGNPSPVTICILWGYPQPQHRGATGIRRVLELYADLRRHDACRYPLRAASHQRSCFALRSTVVSRVERLPGRSHRLSARA